MGWKSVKDYYDIKHIVCVTHAGICIGSPYVHDLIIINNGTVRWGSLGPSSNLDILTYFEALSSDPSLLKSLIDKQDEFVQSISVYTCISGVIVEKKCETPGWPNCTHDGDLMYDNTYFLDYKDALSSAIATTELSVKHAEEMVTEYQNKLSKKIARLEMNKANLKKLKSA